MSRREVLIALGLAAALGGACGAAAADAQGPPAADERQAIQEANALLQEEIRLAASPQTYLVIDVHRGIVLVKARGIEVHRLPLLAWGAGGDRLPAGLFRLAAKPPVDRPRTRPGEDATEHPIEVSDMPAEYQLVLEPSLVIAVRPPARSQPWLWIRGLLRQWWSRPFSKGAGSWLRVTLSPEHARSLAWSVTEGMPVLIGRSTIP